MKILFFAFFSAFLELLWPMANSISIKGELGPILPGFVTYNETHIPFALTRTISKDGDPRFRNC